MQKKISPALLIMSILALLNVAFVPLFHVWGGLFPSGPGIEFFDAIESLLQDSYYWNMWVVQLSVSFAIPSVLMFIFSLAGSRKLCAVSAGIGILLWLRIMIMYVDQNDLSDVFEFKDCNISIGTWIALFLFVAILIVSLRGGHKNSAPENPSGA